MDDHIYYGTKHGGGGTPTKRRRIESGESSNGYNSGPQDDGKETTAEIAIRRAEKQKRKEARLAAKTFAKQKSKQMAQRE